MPADPAFAPVPAEPDHVALEHRVLERWDRDGTFEQLREQNAGGPTFSFIDGPITANNPMGVHHAWGRSLKDLFQRYHAALGEDQRYQNGFDCQGLWVEVEVEKALGLNSKHEIEAYGLDRFARACRDRVAEYSGVQTAQSRRLGMWMDWERSYFTMTDPNISYIWGFLKLCHDRGWLYQGHRPMVWCLRCGTSLSQHEVTATDSYRDIVDPSLYVRFRFTDAPGEALVVWTTTPWTLPANVAAAVKPDAEYVWVDVERRAPRRGQGSLRGGLRRRTRASSAACAARSWSAGPTSTGFDDLPAQAEVAHRVVADADVVLDEGTGIVHIAPGCGAEDFEIGRREELPVLVPVDEAGLFVEGYGELVGHSAHEVPDLVVEHLERGGWLLRQEPHEHRYPHCWRCGTKLIFRVVDEWFIRCDEIRQPMIDANRTVEWTPSHFGKRMEDWLRNMGDWCISRKRYWGLPLPFWFCPDGHMNVVASREELRERATAGLEGLHELHRPWIDPVTIDCAECGAEAARVPEVGDCWLDAGIVPFSTLGYGRDTLRARGLRGRRGRRADEGRPARPRLLGEVVPGRLDLGDARADPPVVLLAAVHVGRARRPAPYQRVLGYEKLHDEHGRAMHKSWGNAIWFDDAIEKIGADVIRWMFAGQDTGAEHELRLRAGQRRRAAPADALEHVPLPRAQRQPGGLPAALGGGRPRARERQPARPLGDRARQRARARLPRRARRLRHAEHDAGRRGVLGRPLELVRAPLAPALLGGRPHGLRDAAPRARAVPAHHGPGHAVPDRGDVGEPGRARLRPGRARLGAPGRLSRARRGAHRGRPARRRWPTCARSASSGTARAPRPSCACASRSPPPSWPAAIAARLEALRRRSRGEIASELNVKTVTTTTDLDSLVEQQVVPNFRALGPRLGAKVQEVRAALAAGDYELGDDGVVHVAGEQLVARRIRVALARARGLRGADRRHRSWSRSTRA